MYRPTESKPLQKSNGTTLTLLLSVTYTAVLYPHVFQRNQQE